MKKLTLVFLISLLLLNKLSFSQTKDTITLAYVAVEMYEIDYATIKKIQKPKILDYEGSYHFGESEGESQLEIIYSNGKLFARTEYNDWEQNGWVLKHDRVPIIFVNNKIETEGSIYSLYECCQTTYLTLDEGDKGLVSHYYDKVESKNHHYIQFNPNSNIKKPKGKYPESSFVKLVLKDLTGIPKSELKIMRNEIFARNGYIFRSGGKMDNYFSKKEWYKSIEKKEKINFDDIEKYNMDMILKLEKL